MSNIQIGLFLARNWKKVVPVVLGIIFFPFLIIALMVSLTQNLSIEDETVDLYRQVSEEVGNSKNVYIDYSQLIGIDAVRYAQDFSRANESNIRELAESFIKTETTTNEVNLTNYKIISNRLSSELDWRLVVQLDSALSSEALKTENTEHIENVVKKFIKEDGTLKTIGEVLEENQKSTDDIQDKYKDINNVVDNATSTTQTSTVKTLEEVAKELGFSDEDIEIAKNLASKVLEQFGSSSIEFTGSQNDFINSIVAGARESYEKYKVFPSLIIAQAIHESGWGKSGLATKGNNLFGIKADSRWQGAKINMRTAEYTKGNKKYYINADFRKYGSFNESVVDHGRFLSENQRYSKHGVFTAKTSSEQAQALQRAGYATDPNYASKLISTIKSYNLTQYDAKDFSLDSLSMNDLQYTQSNSRIPLFLQTDQKWAHKPYGSSNIKISGCGITSVSMVVTGLTGNTVIPPQVAEWAGPRYYVKGAGSSWSLFDGAAKRYGLKVKQINKRDIQTILNNLKQGNPIIVSMGRGDFTRAGHFIVLTGVTSDGKITVNDPNSSTRSKKTWSLSTIISQSSKKGNAPFWAFSV